MTTRRNFLVGAAMAAPAFTLTAQSAHAEIAIVPSLDRSRSGPSASIGIQARILALGNLGYFDPTGVGSKDALSVLDLATGAWSVHDVATDGGHMAMPLLDGGVILMPRFDGAIEIRNRDLTSRKVLKHETMAFSGHCHQAGGRILLAAEPKALAEDDAPSTGSAAEGSLVILNADTLRFEGVIKTGGIHPHDMVELPGGKLAISHYGATWARQHIDAAAGDFMYDLAEPAITVVDMASGVVEKKIVLPRDGAATHMTLGGDGRLWVMPLQYRLFADTNALSLATPEGVILRQDEWKAKHLGMPTPMRAVDPETGKWQDFDIGARLQRRGQSVAANKFSGMVFGAFPYSNTLWFYNPKTGDEGAIRGFDVGIYALRGVCDVPGTPFIAVNGEWEGIVVIDTRSMRSVARYAMPTYWTVHLSAQKATT